MQKIVALVFFALLSTGLLAKTYSIFPDNDLWKEDVMDKSVESKELFDKVCDTAAGLFRKIAEASNERIVVNKKWDDATVNANVMRSGGVVTINMYGGLARRPEIGAEGFALVICHELGHAYGGYPYLRQYSKISAEGQADYYGAKECQKDVLSLLKLETTNIPITNFMEQTCLAINPDPAKVTVCTQSLAGGQELGNLLSVLKKEPTPSFETPDLTIAATTMTSYPKTVQCRLDTYFNGTVGKDRPKCWFNK